MSETAAEALCRHLVICKEALERLENTVDTVYRFHDPDKVNRGLVGDFAHLAELLTEASQFIRNEEEPNE